MNGYDVVVVGSRVAGASTALLLARAGVRVALVERGRPGTDTVSTHTLMRAGVLQLSRWGLLDAVVASGAPPVRRTLFHYAGQDTVEVAIRPGPGVTALYAPRRHVLDAILTEAAAAAGADVLHHTAVTGLVRDDTGRVTGVRVRRRGGPEQELRARVTVGADGLRSQVAASVGAKVERSGRHASAALYRYLDGLPTAGYEWAYGDRATAGLIATHGRTCVFVSCPPERMRRLRGLGTERAFGRLLAAAAPELVDRVAAGSPAGPAHGWAGARGHVRRSWGPGWALVGDAGYFKDPATAHGMTDALRDAELLADELLLALGGGAPEAVALARYQATRDRLSLRLFEVTDEVASFAWDGEGIRSLLRRLNSAMSDEVDHLQSRPVRGEGPALPGLVPADNGGAARLA